MRGKGEYHRKKAEENRRAVFLAVLQNQPATFTCLYNSLRRQGVVQSKRTLARHLSRLVKEGRIAREPAFLHLYHPRVLNPPLTKQILASGKIVNGQFVFDKDMQSKLVFFASEQPKDVKKWFSKLKRLLKGRKKVYVLKLKEFTP